MDAASFNRLCLGLAWLALAAEASAAEWTGRVVDVAGVGVGAAEVSLLGVGGADDERRAVTDERGGFSIAEPPGACPCTVAVLKSGFRALSRDFAAAPGKPLELVLEVQGVREAVTVITGDGPIESVLKLPTTLHETPRAVTVIDAERIRDQNFKLINDAFAYVPGMSVNSFRTGGYHFYARGYRQLPDDTRIDGMAGVNAGGRYGASLFGVEQAVLLRGPAGLLYGSASSPGGMINLITKKPLEVAMTRMDLRTGSYAGNGVGLGGRGFGGVDVDSTGPLLGSGRLFYRALFTVEDMNYFTAKVLDKNRYAQAALTLKLDAEGRSTFTPMLRWTRFNRPNGGGIVVSPSTSLSSNDGSPGPVHTDDLSPLSVNLSQGGGIDETLITGFDLRSNPSSALRLSGSYRYIGYDTDIHQFAPQVTTAAQIAQLRDEHTVSRVESKSRTERAYHNLDLGGSYEARASGWWKTTIHAGLYGRLSTTRATAMSGPASAPQSPINVYTGQASAPLVSRDPELVWTDPVRTGFLNFYLQNRSSLGDGRAVLTFGLGYGRNQVKGKSASDSGLIPNAALLLNASRELALFGSYATSFNPADPDAEDVHGVKGAFAASIGRNYEAGAKYDLANGASSLTLSLFQNEIGNALVQSATNDLNPNGNRYYAEAGTRRSRGVELSADLLPLPAWRLTGSLAYIDAIYTGEGPESAQATLPIPDSRAEKAPKWAYSLWTRYDHPSSGLGASLGLVWQAERLGGNGARTPSAPDPLVLPAYTRVDAALYYRLNEHVDFALNCENLLDELIFVSGSVGSSLEVAAPRTLNLRAGYRF